MASDWEEALLFLEDTEYLEGLADADILDPDTFAERQRCKEKVVRRALDVLLYLREECNG